MSAIVALRWGDENPQGVLLVMEPSEVEAANF